MTIILLMILGLPLWAGLRPFCAADAAGLYYLSVPHYEDELPFRSSFGTRLTLTPAGISWDGGSLAIEIPLQFVSPSLAYGTYRMRGFWGFGVGLRGTIAVGDRAGIILGGGTLLNYYVVDEAFASFYLRTGATFLMISRPYWDMELTVPVTVELRREITAPTVGIGIRIAFYTVRKEDA